MSGTMWNALAQLDRASPSALSPFLGSLTNRVAPDTLELSAASSRTAAVSDGDSMGSSPLATDTDAADAVAAATSSSDESTAEADASPAELVADDRSA
jgi:hypothetical protein